MVQAFITQSIVETFDMAVLPRAAWINVDRSDSYLCTCLAMNSGPLSLRINWGTPRSPITSLKALRISTLLKLRSGRIAKHCRGFGLIDHRGIDQKSVITETWPKDIRIATIKKQGAVHPSTLRIRRQPSQGRKPTHRKGFPPSKLSNDRFRVLDSAISRLNKARASFRLHRHHRTRGSLPDQNEHQNVLRM